MSEKGDAGPVGAALRAKKERELGREVVPLIRLENVTKVYEGSYSTFLSRGFGSWSGMRARLCREGAAENHIGVTAIRDLSLMFSSGEFTAIAGPSGSGKSTLLNLVGALDSPTEGNVFFNGLDLSRLVPEELADFRLRSLGFIFQAYNLIPVLTAVENVEYVLILQGVPKSERRDRALEALESVGLRGCAERRPDRLSGGEQQRVAVARAIVHRPTVVLADEPTANLDSKTSENLLGLMQDLNRTRKITFIFSSHDELVLSRAQRVIQIRDGALV